MDSSRNAREPALDLRRTQKIASSRRRRPLNVEALEERITPTSYPVTDLTDNASDSGSVRYAVNQVNADASASSDTIDLTGIAGTIVLSGGVLGLTRKSGPILITGPGAAALTISGNNSSGVFSTGSGVTASISGLTIANGHTTSFGGGIFNLFANLSVNNCSFSSDVAVADGGGACNFDGTLSMNACNFSSDSTSNDGGAIFNTAGSTLNVNGCTFTGNSAAGSGGGGIYNLSNSSLNVTGCTFNGNTTASGNGGGIGIINGTVTVTASTFAGNSATDGGALASSSAALVAVDECTFSGNAATLGGAISSLGTLAVTNSTVASNSAGSGGGIFISSGSTSLLSTIVVGNTTTGSTTADDVVGSLNTAESAYNLIGVGGSGGLVGGSNNNQVGITTAQANLAPLADYGGPTLTIALLPGSFALQAGSNVLATLAASAGAGDTSITVSDATFLGVGEMIAIDSEQIRISAISGTTVTVVRGFNGTTAAGHNMGASLVVPLDQRGFARSFGGTTDVGALETQPVPVTINSITVDGGTAPVLSAMASAGTVTITTDGANGFAAGQSVLIAGVDGTGSASGFNGAFVIAGVTGNSFTYADGNAVGSTSNAGTATVAGSSKGLLSSGQRSMVDSIVYVFNQAVSLGAGAFTINVLGQGGQVPTISYASPDNGLTWVVTFSGSTVIGNSIANGEYQIVLNNAAVAGISGGGTMANNDIESFYRLYGDTFGNGHQRVNSGDTNAFLGAFNLRSTAANFLAYLDFNDDGRINSTESNAFLGDFNVRYSGFTPTI